MLQIPEELLASATNGEVFCDPSGEFSAIRQQLQAYYPERVRRLKIAEALARMAQSGQYNLPRAIQRGEMATALIVQAEFIKQTCCLVYALNRRFAPFYKWLHRGLRGMPLLPTLHRQLDHLAQMPPRAAHALVETICDNVLSELIAQGFTRQGDSFLEAHVDAVLGH